MGRKAKKICRHRHGVYTKFRNQATLACRTCKARLTLTVTDDAPWRKPGAAGDPAQLQLPQPVKVVA